MKTKLEGVRLKTFKSRSNMDHPNADAEVCNEFPGPIFASLRLGNTAFFEKMLQRWQTVGNSVFNLTGLRLEPQISRFKNELVTPRPPGRFSPL